ncbi:Alpha-L-fucosidase [Hondaea fermentalgiana]|uniref:Alpha-L-fucosidase n=1 Tax=Hondaea fermentalgiana TaxID=2315210 RepID=A0A2R5GIX9_9STRA|nr:Alpha-L-fucosidase [Hondaea fermentalgiana]|eukprot:GBG27824.1 Alpha-L-fucosidase [Hondaea fermentalgiana]
MDRDQEDQGPRAALLADDGNDVSGQDSAPSTPARAPRSRRWTTVAVMLILVMAAVATAGYVFAGSRNTDTGLRGLRQQLFEGTLARLGRPSDRDTREAVEFLVRHMPAHDTHELKAAYLASNVKLAMKAHQMYKDRWTGSLPWIVFLNDVLPYASLAEPRDDWRQTFFSFMQKLVADCETADCVALRLNEESWKIVQPAIIFEAAPPDELNSYSPFQTMHRHNSSCTGLAIFLVDALRSVGVPARVAGVPHWNKPRNKCPHGDSDAQCGNHNWVEAFVNGSWHFIDQHGNSKILDAGWFFPGDTDLQQAGQANHSIFSTSWAPTSILQTEDRTGAYSEFDAARRFPMVWDWKSDVPAWESVRFYHAKSGKDPHV